VEEEEEEEAADGKTPVTVLKASFWDITKARGELLKCKMAFVSAIDHTDDLMVQTEGGLLGRLGGVAEMGRGEGPVLLS